MVHVFNFEDLNKKVCQLIDKLDNIENDLCQESNDDEKHSVKEKVGKMYDEIYNLNITLTDYNADVNNLLESQKQSLQLSIDSQFGEENGLNGSAKKIINKLGDIEDTLLTIEEYIGEKL